MSKYKKTIQQILSGQADASIKFGDIVSLLKQLDFLVLIRGDHHIFTRRDVAEILNLQPKGAMGNAYQVKQIRGILLRYKIGVSDHE